MPSQRPLTLCPPPAHCLSLHPCNSSLLQRLTDAFKAAAEAVKEKSLPVEDRVAKWLRIWMKVGCSSAPAECSSVCRLPFGELGGQVAAHLDEGGLSTC